MKVYGIVRIITKMWGILAFLFNFFRSFESKAYWWAYRIGSCPYVCMSTFSNIFSETTGQIETKFHMEPPWDGGMKVCSNGPGHMTKSRAL